VSTPLTLPPPPCSDVRLILPRSDGTVLRANSLVDLGVGGLGRCCLLSLPGILRRSLSCSTQ
jgi:hypothetical protein